MNGDRVTGSLSRKSGKFYVTIYYYESGVRRRKSYPTKISADESNKRKFAQNERAARRMMDELIRTFVVPSDKIVGAEQSLCDAIRIWLREQEGRLAPASFTGYSYAVTDLFAYFSEHPVKVGDVTPKIVQNYIAWETKRRMPGPSQVIKTRSADGAGVNNTVMKRVAVLRSVLQAAKRDGIISRNPAASGDSWVQLPKVQRASFQVLNHEEAQALLTVIESEPLWFRLATLLGLLYGLRRSEVLGIRIQDIDFTQRQLFIQNTVTQQTLHHSNVITAKPKTKGTKLRTFTLTTEVVNLLRRQIDQNNENRMIFGSCYDTTWEHYLFRDIDGRLIAPNRLTNAFKNFLRKNNLKEIRFHDLRHSCASLLYAQGISPKTIQAILGHSTLSTTTEIYTHLFGKEKDEALEALSNALVIPRAADEKTDGKTDGN